MEEAKKILEREDANLKLKTSAIKSLGTFGSCLDAEQEVEFLCQYLMKKAASIFVQTLSETSSNEAALLPVWLQSLGSMLSHRAASQVGQEKKNCFRIEEKLLLQKLFVALFSRYLDFSN